MARRWHVPRRCRGEAPRLRARPRIRRVSPDGLRRRPPRRQAGHHRRLTPTAIHADRRGLGSHAFSPQRAARLDALVPPRPFRCQQSDHCDRPRGLSVHAEAVRAQQLARSCELRCPVHRTLLRKRLCQPEETLLRGGIGSARGAANERRAPSKYPGGQRSACPEWRHRGHASAARVRTRGELQMGACFRCCRPGADLGREEVLWPAGGCPPCGREE
jgi:hypothetical protein